ncbi:MAG TPA: recombinase RecT [bacterium]|nr:recombinase RecT [bacterium]
MTKAAAVKKDVDIITSTEKRIQSFMKEGRLEIPEGYSVGNALRAAYLNLQDVQDSQKRPALIICTKQSIANALLKMVVDGLSVEKKQCYFMVYGTKLVCMSSYFGDMFVAKRDADVFDAIPEIIYEGDTFKYKIVGHTKTITEHIQEFANIDESKIVGAYCTVIFNDGRPDHVEIVTKKQIDNSWSRGKTKKVQDSDPGEMSKRTVIKRALKRFINSSVPTFPELAEQEILAGKVEFGEETQTIDFEETPQLPPSRDIVEKKPNINTDKMAPAEEPATDEGLKSDIGTKGDQEGLPFDDDDKSEYPEM